MTLFGDSRLPQRVWDKIQVNPATGCWEWTAYVRPDGYGRIGWEGNLQYSHRLVYMSLVGKIPIQKQIDHLCRNRRCCAPHHLEAVTPSENATRGEVGGHWQRKVTHCPKGHPYSGSNLYTAARGSRGCKSCIKATRMRYLQRKKNVNVVSIGDKDDH